MLDDFRVSRALRRTIAAQCRPKRAADRLMNSTACSGSAIALVTQALGHARDKELHDAIRRIGAMSHEIQRPADDATTSVRRHPTRDALHHAIEHQAHKATRPGSSRNSSTPPSVNFISGSALSCAHCSEMSMICCWIDPTRVHRTS
jgi:hypothetical protein